MNPTKTLIFFGLFIGSVLGGYLPVLWGDSAFSMSAVFTSALGAFLGVWLGYKLAHKIG
ncbi:MAG: hypothetical protein NTY33_04870 [Candidatus Moranbacteria bacterium]|nr:hypothetical protein [Candidatus Moranbacteria bacterium]